MREICFRGIDYEFPRQEFTSYEYGKSHRTSLSKRNVNRVSLLEQRNLGLDKVTAFNPSIRTFYILLGIFIKSKFSLNIFVVQGI